MRSSVFFFETLVPQIHAVVSGGYELLVFLLLVADGAIVDFGVPMTPGTPHLQHVRHCFCLLQVYLVHLLVPF